MKFARNVNRLMEPSLMATGGPSAPTASAQHVVSMDILESSVLSPSVLNVEKWAILLTVMVLCKGSTEECLSWVR